MKKNKKKSENSLNKIRIKSETKSVPVQEPKYILNANPTIPRNRLNNTFKKRLSNVQWHEILNNNDVNDDYNKFVKSLETIYDECIPIKKCIVNKKKEPFRPLVK